MAATISWIGLLLIVLPFALGFFLKCIGVDLESRDARLEDDLEISIEELEASSDKLIDGIAPDRDGRSGGRKHTGYAWMIGLLDFVLLMSLLVGSILLLTGFGMHVRDMPGAIESEDERAHRLHLR